MRSAPVAEWMLSQVLQPDRAVSTVGDWLEGLTDRGILWFWSCVFRTALWRILDDFSESPGFMLGLALRVWLYSFWLMVGTYFGLFVGVCILVPVAMLVGFLAHQVHWHPSWPVHPPAHVVGALIAQVWIGWCEFQAGRWIARHAPGRELAAGVTACLAPIVFFSLMQLFAIHFWGAEINRYIASHPYDHGSLPNDHGSLPTLLPSEIFLLAGILWSRHKSMRSVAE